MRGEVSPTTDAGLNTMTPAQQRREIQRQAREVAAAQRAAERERKAQAVAERARQRSVDSAIRTGGRVLTSRAGQSVLRGIFGTIFGGGKSR
jgi:ribosomal protein L4